MRYVSASIAFQDMKALALVPCLWFLLLSGPVQAQVQPDTTRTVLQADTSKITIITKERDPYLQKGELRKRLIVPAIFVGAGLLLIDNGLYDRQDIRHDLRTTLFPNFKTDIDDYLIFAPAASLVVFDIFSNQNRHAVTRQVALLAGAGALSSAIMWPLKKITNEPRPNGENNYSFPSGHTTYAFVVATMVSREFKGKSKWIGIASYTAAGATGLMRVLNDAHWMSDVLAGAGVGILSTNLVYMANDRWFRNAGFNAQFMPTILPNGSPGMGMVIQLK